ncbi:Protein FAM54B-A [Gossypium arboreum]|uniref:Protein FAM54B-A n=1 Tax=Gossypium arboreum TaxID=29729 RepID=A0A0B0MTB5_GOSAR|nr:Protein FAM54B-A [Gossypium arboreum]
MVVFQPVSYPMSKQVRLLTWVTRPTTCCGSNPCALRSGHTHLCAKPCTKPCQNCKVF